MKLYLICGKARSGKNTFANLLKEELEKCNKKVCLLKITSPLYLYAKEYFSWDGSEDNKPRSLLQYLGIDLIKNKLKMNDFLINRLKEDIKILSEFFDIGIITDGRLKEELDELKREYNDIIIIHIERKNYENGLTIKEKSHITETDLDFGYNYNYSILNDNIFNLKLKVQDIVKKEENFMNYKIAIDGPSSSGKSTIAKLLAKKLSFVYVDTGAMYRAMGLYFIRNKISCEDKEEIEKNLSNVNINIKYENGEQQIYLNNENVTNLIRTDLVSKYASVTSTYLKVREKLVAMQKDLGNKNNVIMDGRDIGTVVLPDATLKIFLTATQEERVKRRYKELKEKDSNILKEDVEKEMIERDYRDSHRDNSPLRKAEDAIEVDTTYLNIEEVADVILKLFNEKRGNCNEEIK